MNYSTVCRTWADPNAMQVDAVHVSGGQERQGSCGNAQLDKGKVGKGGKNKANKGGKGKEKMRNWPAGSKVNAGIAKRRDTRRRSAER